MDRAHDPGCDQQHPPRQRCISTYPSIVCGLCGAANDPAAVRCARCGVDLASQTLASDPAKHPPAPIGATRRRVALSAELAPGLMIMAFYFVAAKGYLTTDEPGDDLAGLELLMFLAVVLGAGWFAVGRIGAGCALLVLRWIACVFLLFMWIEAFSNDSGCYGDFDDVHGCYAGAVRRFDVTWVTFLLMPLTSAGALYLSMRRSPWHWPWQSRFGLVSALRLVGGVVLGSLIVVGIPVALGFAYSATDYGRSTLVVRNETGETLNTSYTPGYDPGEDIPPGATMKLRPLFDRFDDPRSVSFYTTGDYQHWTSWRCQWDYAKAREPLVIDFANSSGCEMSTRDLSDFGSLIDPTDRPVRSR